MLDTNILVSALFYPSATTAYFFELLLTGHRAVLCSHVVDELKRVARTKFPQRAFAADIFLKEFPYEAVNTPQIVDTSLIPAIRDPNDFPILATAIRENVDILVTGDKDFLVFTL